MGGGLFFSPKFYGGKGDYLRFSGTQKGRVIYFLMFSQGSRHLRFRRVIRSTFGQEAKKLQ
jgi:hypothetical protein